MYTTIRTRRTVVSYDGFTFELDHVMEPLEICEVECETEEPERYKALATGLLDGLGIPWEYSRVTKLARVRDFLEHRR